MITAAYVPEDKIRSRGLGSLVGCARMEEDSGTGKGRSSNTARFGSNELSFRDSAEDVFIRVQNKSTWVLINASES